MLFSPKTGDGVVNILVARNFLKYMVEQGVPKRPMFLYLFFENNFWNVSERCCENHPSRNKFLFRVADTLAPLQNHTSVFGKIRIRSIMRKNLVPRSTMEKMFLATLRTPFPFYVFFSSRVVLGSSSFCWALPSHARRSPRDRFVTRQQKEHLYTQSCIDGRPVMAEGKRHQRAIEPSPVRVNSNGSAAIAVVVRWEETAVILGVGVVVAERLTGRTRGCWLGIRDRDQGPLDSHRAVWHSIKSDWWTHIGRHQTKPPS